MSQISRFKVDYESFLSQHDVIYESPVEPHERKPGENFIDGPLLGNGDTGAVVHGTVGKLRINVAKNDVWDRRDDTDKITRAPLTQKQFVDMIMKDKDGSALTRLRKISEELAVCWNTDYPCPKPCGELVLENFTHSDPDFRQRLCLYDGLLLSESHSEDSQIKISTFVAADKNLIPVRYSCQGKVELEFVMDLIRQINKSDKAVSSPDFGCDGKYFWIRHRLPADPLYPKGFEYVMMGAIEGLTYETVVASNCTRVFACGKEKCTFEIYLGVATSRDAEDPFREAGRIVDEAISKGYQTILEEHKDSWHSFWRKSFVNFSDEFMENLWYLNQYFLACCSKKGKVAPGLYGSWITNDSSSWHGDYHLDYNFEQQYWGVYASNHPELAHPYYDYIFEILPVAKREAADIYNCRGAKYPITAYPTAMERNPYPVFPWDRCMCLSAWAAQGFWWHYKYTLDEKFLRKRAYPVMVECARFYQDFLKKEDGKYVIWPTVSPEHYGVTAKFALNRNCTIDLALIKFLLKAVIEASGILGVDEKERPAWQEILDNLADYPSYETKEGEVFVDVENAWPITYNCPVPIAPVFPGEDIGIDSPAKLHKIAERTAKTLRINGADGFIGLPMAWMRLGLKEMYQSFREMSLERIRHNGALAQIGRASYRYRWWNCGPVVENFAFTAVINEMLLQSYNGKIRVFPALPDGMSARFSDLRAVGAFLVSSEKDPDGVRYVGINSLKGGPCKIVNPWGKDKVQIRNITENRKPRLSENQAIISFNAKKGYSYILQLEQRPFESFPEITIRGKKQAKPRPEGIGKK